MQCKQTQKPAVHYDRSSPASFMVLLKEFIDEVGHVALFLRHAEIGPTLEVVLVYRAAILLRFQQRLNE